MSDTSSPSTGRVDSSGKRVPTLTDKHFAEGADLIGQRPSEEALLLMQDQVIQSSGKASKNQIEGVDNTWPDGVIPFRIQSNTFTDSKQTWYFDRPFKSLALGQLSEIAGGILNVVSNTCLKIEEDVDEIAEDFVLIGYIRPGCNANLGYSYGLGQHTLNLELPNCPVRLQALFILIFGLCCR